MAVQFSSGQYKLTTSGVLTGAGASAMTYSCWMRPDNDTDAFGAYWAVKNAQDLSFQNGNASAGRLESYNNFSNNIWEGGTVLTSISTTQWYYLAFVQNGTSLKLYSATLGASTLTDEGSDTASTSTPSFDTMGWGNFPYYGQQKACSLAFYREWADDLSKTELESEMASTTAVRTSNLNRELRFASGALNTDSSGLGRTMTFDNGGSFVANPTLSSGPTGRGRQPLAVARGGRNNAHYW